MAVAAYGPRQIQLPAGNGPWSWRVFGDPLEAWRFFHRLQDGDPPPRQLNELHLAPDGSVVEEGSWLVLYRPIIAADRRRTVRAATPDPVQRNRVVDGSGTLRLDDGDRTTNPTEAFCS